MTVNIANVASNNTFDFHRSITNQIAAALRNIVVTTNQNVASGNAVVNGFITANGLITNNLIIEGTASLNIASSNLTLNGLTANVGIFTTLTANVLNIINTANIADLTVNTISFTTAAGNTANVNALNVVQTLNTSNLVATGTANISVLIGVTNGSIGQLISNSIVANSQLKIGNSASGNITIAFPNTVQSNGSFFLNGNGSWALPVSAAPGTNTQVLFNNVGSIAGNSGLTYNLTTASLTVSNSFIAPLYTIGNTTVGSVTTSTRVTLASTGDQFVEGFTLAAYRAAKYQIVASNPTTNSYYFADLNIIHNGNTSPTWTQTVSYTNTEFITLSVYANSTTCIINANPTIANTSVNLHKVLIRA